MLGCRRSQRCAGRHNHAVSLYQEGAVEFCDFLDGVAHRFVDDVALLFGIPLEGVDAAFLAVLLHVAVVADDEQRADGFPLASLVGEFDRQSQNALEDGAADVLGQFGLAY